MPAAPRVHILKIADGVPQRVLGDVLVTRALRGPATDAADLEAFVDSINQRADTIQLSEEVPEEDLEDPPADEETPADKRKKLLTNTLGALTTWIPAEIVALYAGVIAATPAPEETAPVEGELSPAAVQTIGIWVVALVATPLLVWLTAWIDKKTRHKRSRAAKYKLRFSMFFAAIAFVLWSASIPGSIWTLFPPFADNSGLWLFLLLIVATFFSLIATKITGRGPKKEDPPPATS